MVIDSNNSINPGAAGANRSRTSGSSVNSTNSKVPDAGKPTPTGKDNVVLSPEAQNLNRLQARISDMPDVDMERVNAIKKALAEGKFEINPERIAENMLKQDDLLG